MRLGSFAGLFDFLFTYAYGFLFNDELAQTWYRILNNNDCIDFGRKVGRILSLSVTQEVYNNVYY